jgi:hypothetical protein
MFRKKGLKKNKNREKKKERGKETEKEKKKKISKGKGRGKVNKSLEEIKSDYFCCYISRISI